MVRLGNIDLVREEALIEHDNNTKPKRRQSKRQSSDEDWSFGWCYPSKSSNDDSKLSSLDSNKNSKDKNFDKSPPSKHEKIHQTSLQADNLPLNEDKINEKEEENKSGINVKLSGDEKDNTTSEQFKDIISKEQNNSMPENTNHRDEKSQKVIDKLKNLFKF